LAARVLEIVFLVVVTSFIALLVLVLGMTNTSLPEEQVLTQEFKAKQLILALDTLPASSTDVPPETSVIDLLRFYYTTGREEYLNAAKDDIYNYARKMLPDSAWEVKTTDGKLDIKSPLLERKRVCGSASVNLLGSTNITAMVCSF